MDILSNFVENLKEMMFDNSVSKKDLCKELDIDLSQFYRYLRKESTPCLTTITKIADYFSCSIDYMLGYAPHLIDDKLNYTPPFSIAFAQILNEYGITRYQINKQMKIASSELDYWYKGKRIPTIESIINLTKYLDCTIDKLLGREFR